MLVVYSLLQALIKNTLQFAKSRSASSPPSSHRDHPRRVPHVRLIKDFGIYTVQKLLNSHQKKIFRAYTSSVYKIIIHRLLAAKFGDGKCVIRSNELTLEEPHHRMGHINHLTWIFTSARWWLIQNNLESVVVAPIESLETYPSLANSLTMRLIFSPAEIGGSSKVVRKKKRPMHRNPKSWQVFSSIN